MKTGLNDPDRPIRLEGLEPIVLVSGPAKRCSVGRSEATTTTATMAAATTIPPAAATASRVAGHLRETRVNSLLRILQNGDEITGLFGI